MKLNVVSGSPIPGGESLSLSIYRGLVRHIEGLRYTMYTTHIILHLRTKPRIQIYQSKLENVLYHTACASSLDH